MKPVFRSVALAALAASLMLGTPAEAFKRLEPGPVVIDPALGYVMVRIGPTRGDKGKAQNLWIWRYDPERGEIRTLGKKDPARIPKGEDAGAYFGDRPFTVGDEASVFITSLTPGEWVIHGTETTCLCLGSYAFTVKAGEITDLGNVLIAREDGKSDVPVLAEQKLAEDLLDRGFVVTDAVQVRPAADGDPLPPEVASLPIVRATLTEDVRFPNRGPTRFLYPGGLLVNRALGLPAPVNGDGSALLARVREDSEVRTKPIVSKPKEDKPVEPQPN